MEINIITINTTASIPLFRYIINYFINDMNNPVHLTENTVKEYHNYYTNHNNLSYHSISEYDTYEEFMSQSKFSKIKKYFTLINTIINIINSKKQQLIYTNDFQVLSIALFFKCISWNRKTKIIYHQFELIEKEKITRFNKILFNFVLKRANKINLAVFPEINRLNYFITESSININQTFVLPNSCESSQSDLKAEKHTLFEKIPIGSFIVAHIGHIGGKNFHLGNFIAAIEKLQDHKNIYFLFLGRQSVDFKNIIKEKKLSNIITIENVPHVELKQIYPFIDLGVILYKATNLNTEYCAPNKLYELWSYGIPVIGHYLKGLISLFDIKEKGVLTNFENVDSIVNSIIKYASNSNDKRILLSDFDNNLAISNHLNLLRKRIEHIIEKK